MIIEAKNNKQIILSRIELIDFEQLTKYLQDLSNQTKFRFGPHPYDLHSIANLYNSSENYIGYIGRDFLTMEIIAYSIIKIGYLEHDSLRLKSYGIDLNQNLDCTFAPSVADNWQGLGIGNKLFQFIISDLTSRNIKRVILWGGVQVSNETAVNYYLKNGFKILGSFEYNGDNFDMIFELNGLN
jgi:GNAT superfamily N-acetyltransferase